LTFFFFLLKKKNPLFFLGFQKPPFFACPLNKNHHPPRVFPHFSPKPLLNFRFLFLGLGWGAGGFVGCVGPGGLGGGTKRVGNCFVWRGWVKPWGGSWGRCFSFVAKPPQNCFWLYEPPKHNPTKKKVLVGVEHFVVAKCGWWGGFSVFSLFCSTPRGQPPNCPRHVGGAINFPSFPPGEFGTFLNPPHSFCKNTQVGGFL